jgi:hypothetical protein
MTVMEKEKKMNYNKTIHNNYFELFFIRLFQAKGKE